MPHTGNLRFRVLVRGFAGTDKQRSQRWTELVHLGRVVANLILVPAVVLGSAVFTPACRTFDPAVPTTVEINWPDAGPDIEERRAEEAPPATPAQDAPPAVPAEGSNRVVPTSPAPQDPATPHASEPPSTSQ